MQLDLDDIRRVIHDALAEDIGKGDITSELTVPADALMRAHFVTRADTVVCGLPVVERLFGKLELPAVAAARVSFEAKAKEGAFVKAGTVLCTVSGNARMILASERVALNILQRMCGIASQAKRYADAVKGINVKVLDTRKTTPGLRSLEKYAVAVGGCTNHRMRLDDGIMIKDNHVRICGGVKAAVDTVKKNREAWMKSHPEFSGTYPIHVECDTLAQVQEAVAAGATHILLDNMIPAQLRKAVVFVAGRAVLEASGGVTLENIRDIASTGVQAVSVGALTHSVPSIDIGLDVE